MFWVVNCGCVPPFRVDGRWVRVGEDEDAICCVPSAYTLFRTWRRAVSHVLRCCNLVPGCAVTVTVSAKCLGARMPLAGLSWRPSVPLAVRRDLAFQFASPSTLASLRLPPCGRRFGGIMARNPASYVSSLTLTVETNVRESASPSLSLMRLTQLSINAVT